MEVNLVTARDFHSAILFFQRRMRMARRDYDFPISSDSALLLSMLTKNSSLSGVSLASLLKVPKTKVSRMFIALESDGYVEAKSVQGDRRVKVLNYTDKGIEILKSLISLNNEVSMRGISTASRVERDKFTKLFKSLNDGLGYDNLISDSEEDSLVLQQRRLAVGSGMIGSNYMDTGLDIDQVHVLFELYRAGSELKFSYLNEILPIHKSKLSRVIKYFAERGFVRKEGLLDDKRTLACQITREGKQFYNKLFEGIEQKYLKALNDIDSKDIKAFIKFMETLEGVPIPDPPAREFDIKVCESADDYKIARSLLVEILVAKNAHHSLVSELIPEDRFVAMAYASGSPVGLAVFSAEGKEEYFEFNPESMMKVDLVERFRKIVHSQSTK